MISKAKIYINYASLFLEVAGVTVILVGVLTAIYMVSINWKLRSKSENYLKFRKHVGEGILLGLEILMAADIINSVAVEPSFKSVGVLALIVLVRTFLSFTLEVEMTGRWPWQQKEK